MQRSRGSVQALPDATAHAIEWGGQIKGLMSTSLQSQIGQTAIDY